MNSFGDEIKVNTFKEKQGVVFVKDITKNTKELRSGSLGFAEAMLVIYNKHMKPGIQWSKLYSVKATGKKKKVNKEFNAESEVEQDAS